MKRFSLPLSIILIAFITFLSSCSDEKEEVPVDPRDQAMATYNYRTKFYLVDTDGSLDYTGSGDDETGTFIVSKTTNGFEAKEGGEVLFAGEKVAAASNGFTFDIPSQTISVDGVSFNVDGYDGVTLNGVKYNGMYEPGSDKMTAYFYADVQVTVEGQVYEMELVFEVIATKA
jgi:hypothetical protein